MKKEEKGERRGTAIKSRKRERCILRVYENESLRGGKDGARGCEGNGERWWRQGGGGTAEDEGGGGVHCGFIPANTFIMADLAEPVTHCRGYISASIPTLTFSLLRPLHPLHRHITIPTESSPVYILYSDKISLFQ